MNRIFSHSNQEFLKTVLIKFPSSQDLYWNRIVPFKLLLHTHEKLNTNLNAMKDDRIFQNFSSFEFQLSFSYEENLIVR